RTSWTHDALQFKVTPSFGTPSRRAMKRSIRSVATLLLASIAVPSSVPAQDTPPRAAGSPGSGADTLQAVRLDSLLDLDTVIRRALAVSPAVTAAQEGVRIAHSERRVAFGEYLPSVAATSAALSSDVGSVSFGSGLPPTAYSAGVA